MKTTKRQKEKRIAAAKAAIMQNNIMNRFIREIEREDPLDNDTLKSVFALQLQTAR